MQSPPDDSAYDRIRNRERPLGCGWPRVRLRSELTLKTRVLDIYLPLAIWAVGFSSIWFTMRGYGPAWDEPFSIVAADVVSLGVLEAEGGSVRVPGCYMAWLLRPSLKREWIEWNWRPNHEHPPLAKIVIGLTHHAFSRYLSSTHAARVAASLFFATLLAVVYLAMKSWVGWRAGLFASLSLLLMPRVFGHGHLAGLDIPLALTSFATMWAVEAAVGRCAPASAPAGGSPASPSFMRPVLPLVYAGCVWGLALLTKINAIFLPAAFVPWVVWRLRLRALPGLVAMFLVAAIVFIAGWPWLWHDTGDKVAEFYAPITEKLTGRKATERVNLPAYYFGQVYDKEYPPSYPIVMLLITVPVGLLAMSGLGIGAWLGGERERETKEEGRGVGVGPPAVAVLLLLGLAIQIVPLVPPGVPKYDGERLLLAAFPFLACFAGMGGEALFVRLRAGFASLVGPAADKLAAAALTLLLLSQATGIVASHPFELGYYNLLVGGMGGASRRGLETNYWGECVNEDVFRFLNERAPRGAAIAFFPERDLVPLILASDGYLRRDLRYVNLQDAEKERARYVVILMRQGMVLRDEKARSYLPRVPVFTVARRGVVFCAVYER